MKELNYDQKQALGFTYILDSLRPASPYGQELVRELKPLSRGQEKELQRQLDNIARILTGTPEHEPHKNRLLRILMTMKNLRPTAEKCRQTDLNEIELFELKRFLLQCGEIYPLWLTLQDSWELEGIALQDTEDALNLLDPQKNRVAAFYLEDGTSPLLRQLRSEKRMLEAELRICEAHLRDELQARRSHIAAREEQEEIRLRHELTLALRPHMPQVLMNMEALGELDFTIEKAKLALKYGGCKPVVTHRTIKMTDMLHPQLQDRLTSQGSSFTPVSISLEPGAAVITGANMGGKSVAMKTLALNLYAMHCGIFPFAGSAAAPLFDSFHILAEDKSSLEQGLSSFGGEIVALNQILEEAEQGFAFVLLDEFARGTNPQEGAALMQAVTRYLNKRQVISVLATHYDQVAPWGNIHYQVAGLRDMEPEAVAREISGLSGEACVRLISRHMNYGLYRVSGKEDCPRDAVNICRLLGMKEEILGSAEKIYTVSYDNC